MTLGCYRRYCAPLKGVGALIALINCKPHYSINLPLYKTGQPSLNKEYHRVN